MVLRQVFLILQNLINFIKFRREVDPSSPLIIADDQHIPSRDWAQMIKEVYEVDPLICPSCGGQMRIVAFIEDHNAIDRIIRHLKLSFSAECPPPQQAQPQLAMTAEERVEYLKSRNAMT
jgi:hypothetical protein